MAEKIINSRIQLKTDTSSNWSKATNFKPKKGEFIFYSDIQKFKIGDGIKKISALDFVNEDEKIVTQSEAGLMSSADKIKLDGIATGANKYVLPTASSTTLGGVKSGSSVTSTTGLTACPIIGGVPYYKEGSGSGGSSSVTALTKVQFDEVWKLQGESWAFVYNGTLTSTQGDHYIEYDCISIDLYGSADAFEASNRYIYLFFQSNYYEDNDVTDYWRWVGYDRSNTKYTLDIVHNFDSDTWTWTLTTDSSLSPTKSQALYMRGADNKQDYLTLQSGTNYYVQIQDLGTKTSGWGWFINGAFAFTNWIAGQALFITVSNNGSWDIVNFKITNTSKNYMISCWPISNYSETCVLADTQILTLDTATDTLVTKPVQDIQYGDTLAYWSPMKAGLIYNKVVMPPVVGDCTNYNRVYFSDGSTVDVFGTQFFWNCDKDLLVDYMKMTPNDRVCKSNGDIVNFDHYESLVAPQPIKHYTLMTDKGRYVANGIQTGDKVELFYPRLMREENRKYWDALPVKTQEFFKKKHVEGMERRNWKYSTLYHETIGAYNNEKNQLNEVIEEKQSYLDSTDYQVVKKMEGLLTDDEFAPVKVARQEARDAINAARARIAELDSTIKGKEGEVKATIYGKRKYTYHNAFEGKTRAVLDYEEPSAD